MEYELIRSRIKNIYIKIRNGKILVTAPNRVPKYEIDKIVEKKRDWINQRLKEEKNKKEIPVPTKEQIDLLKEKLEYFVKIYSYKLDVNPNKIRIKSIKTAWGSCSAKRNITFSSSLANKSDQFIEYVVVHELCHIKYMNHSEKFWKLVENNIQNYKQIRKEGKT